MSSEPMNDAKQHAEAVREAERRLWECGADWARNFPDGPKGFQKMYADEGRDLIAGLSAAAAYLDTIAGGGLPWVGIDEARTWPNDAVIAVRFPLYSIPGHHYGLMNGLNECMKGVKADETDFEFLLLGEGEWR